MSTGSAQPIDHKQVLGVLITVSTPASLHDDSHHVQMVATFSTLESRGPPALDCAPTPNKGVENR